MKKKFVLILVALIYLIITPIEIEARRHKESRRRKSKEGTGQQGYIIFEMVKVEKKEPYPLELRYPLFKGTSHYQHEKLNSFFQEKMTKEWICPETKNSSEKNQKFSLNSKILTFNPSIISIKVSLDYDCGENNKGSREIGINLDPKLGTEIPLEVFIDKNEFTSLKEAYLERALVDSVSDECKTYLKDNKSLLNQFEFFLTKDQVSVKAVLEKNKVPCEILADFSFDEFNDFKPTKIIKSLMNKTQGH